MRVSSFQPPEVPERTHPRVPAGFPVEVRAPDGAWMAQARDLSMVGLLLVGFAAEPGELLELSIALPGDYLRLFRGRVMRVHPEGVAVEFERLDWEDLFALARFLHPRLP
ncbi:MAG TPA: PilZ domain-containing protein [Myxococcaceae bacterium]|nr:PilZ domain-containing protein [Myxococcaceae bacterium]